jgi:AraC-like DNA-binding protein
MERRMTLNPAMLVSWGARAVYIGPGFQLPAHRNAVAVLALALKSPMRVALDARDLELGFRSCQSVLIEPNQLHLIETSNDDHAFIYIDALSHDLCALGAHCSQPSKNLHFDLKNELEVIDLLAHMRRDTQSWMNTQETLAKRLGFVPRPNEPRINTVVQALLLRPDYARRAEDWAKEVGLSSSRFQHLFKECVGVSFRRFRLWARMRLALSHAMRGASLTHAAMEAGLSSSAHLSSAFKAMFGMSPSQLIGASPLYVET